MDNFDDENEDEGPRARYDEEEEEEEEADKNDNFDKSDSFKEGETDPFAAGDKDDFGYQEGKLSMFYNYDPEGLFAPDDVPNPYAEEFFGDKMLEKELEEQNAAADVELSDEVKERIETEVDTHPYFERLPFAEEAAQGYLPLLTVDTDTPAESRYRSNVIAQRLRDRGIGEDPTLPQTATSEPDYEAQQRELLNPQDLKRRPNELGQQLEPPEEDEELPTGWDRYRPRTLFFDVGVVIVTRGSLVSVRR